MLQAIALRSGDLRNTLLAQRRTVRLAALLHDIGHLPFSHVSERYYTELEAAQSRYLTEVEDWTADVAHTLRVSAPSLAELLSVAIVSTPSFRRLLETATYSPDEIAIGATAIVGHPVTVRLAFISQLISNVIDADKLDYMFRDGYVTGVPVAVDLERLLFKLRAVEASPEDFVRGSEDSVEDVVLAMMAKHDKALVLGTDVTGHTLVYDLAVSRDMLFERVYLHHKTRAAERIALEILHILKLHPADLYQHDDSLFGAYGARRYRRIRPLIAMLENRRLPRRAFALSYGFLVEQAPEALKGRLRADDQTAWDQLDADLSNSRRRRALQREIAERYAGIAALLQIADAAPQIWVDVPPDPPTPDDSQFMVIRPDKQLAPGRSFSAEAAAHPRSAPDIFFVFATGTAQQRELAHIASERTFYERYGLALGRAAADYAKIDEGRVQTHKRDLEMRDPTVFDTAGVLRPRCETIRRGNQPSRLASLGERFQRYALARVSQERLERYLDQFPEHLALPMSQAVEAITYLDRPALGRAFVDFMKLDGACVLVPLTSRLEKSAAHISYYFPDHPSPPDALSLEEALTQSKAIVFYDDCLISGSQARTVLQSWFGQPADLDEDIARTLDSHQLDSLRTATVRFRFAYGEHEELAKFADVAQQFGLGSDVRARVDRAVFSTLDDQSIDRRHELRQYLAVVGEQLLLSTRHRVNPEKWTETRCRESALGYGGSERLVVMEHNCPTGTVTALWKAGAFRGAEWLPLFPRSGEEPIEELARQGVDALATLLTMVTSIDIPTTLRDDVQSAVDARNDGDAATAAQALEVFSERLFKLTATLGADTVGELLGPAARARHALTASVS
jgi:HD superfamily phosphohydrolase